MYPSDVTESRLFKDFPPELMTSLATENITVNFHKWSISMEVCGNSITILKYLKKKNNIKLHYTVSFPLR